MSSTSKSQTNNEYSLTPEQSLFVQSEKRYVGYVSGVGAGKTFAGISRALRNMLAWNPGEMGAIIAPTKTMVIDVIVNEMRDLGLFEKGFEYKSAHTEEPGIHGPNGTRALILSADNTRTVERLKGLNLAWWWIDEEAEVPPRAREILMQRLRTGEYRNGFITTTPKGYNHTHEFFVKNPENKEYTHGSGHVYESDDRLAITGVPTWANPHTPDDYHEDMEDLPEQIKQQEVQGMFTQIGGGVFQKDMFVYENPEKVSGRVEPVITVDPAATSDAMAAEANDSDFWAMTVGLVHPQGYMYVLDSSQDRGMTLHEGCEWIERRVRYTSDSVGKRPSLLVEANQAQQFLVDELADRGLQVQPINTSQSKEDKIIDMSIPITNGRVKFLSYDDGRYDDLLNQLLAWPEVQHDDLIDSLSMLVKHAPVPTRIHSGEYNERDLW